MKQITQEWIDSAEDDITAATVLLNQPSPICDIICFHCQQSAEKYLKACLQESDMSSL